MEHPPPMLDDHQVVVWSPGAHPELLPDQSPSTWSASPNLNVLSTTSKVIEEVNDFPFGDPNDFGEGPPQSYSNTPNEQFRHRSNDKIEHVYIAVMGVTASGKSTFIRDVSGKDVTIGHDLQSCTAKVEDVDFIYSDKIRVHLIDTPGFDDTHKSDAEVLQDIAGWLGDKYEANILLSGIIFLHRVSDPRMSGGSMRNLGMFKKLCGKDCYTSVLFVTTFWQSANLEKAFHNERELTTKKEYWGEMLNRGSRYKRLDQGPTSAQAILSDMVQRRKPFKAAIQVEMVDKKLGLKDTAAGQQLNADLLAMEERHNKEMTRLKEEWQQAKRDHDDEAAKLFEDFGRKMQKELEDDRAARQQLQIHHDKIIKEREEQVEKD